jgi:hypothetical protein
VFQEPHIAQYRREKAKVELLEILKTRLIEKAVSDLESHGLLEPLLRDLARKRKDPYSISEKVVDHSFALRLLPGRDNPLKKKGY